MTLSFFRGAVISLALIAGGGLPAALAQSTDATVDADTQACMQADDNEACERVYDYLREKLEGAKARELPALQAKVFKMGMKGCELGNGWLCNSTGYSYDSGRDGFPDDSVAALSQYEKACSAGLGMGCGNAGYDYEVGDGVAEDRAQAEKLYAKGCRIGSMATCEYWADWLLYERVKAEPAAVESVAEMKAHCADMALKGPSCSALGSAYYWGSDGVDEDENEAGKYWSKACREIRDAKSCYYIGLKALRDDTIEEHDNPVIISGVQSVMAACRFGWVEACEYAAPAFAPGSFDYPQAMTEARYQLCVQKPNLEDCAFAGDAYETAGFLGNSPTGVYEDFPKATLAWLTACRNFGAHCVEAANMHLKDRQPARPSPNLAIGILETACDNGDAAACERKTAVIAETGGVTGSYIDPMASDDERFLLAQFDIENGDLQRGRETLQWLAFMGHTDAELELAIDYFNGMTVIPPNRYGNVPPLPLYDRKEVMYELFERAARKGIPGAAMRVAAHKYEENDHEGGDSYENAIARALYLGADGAVEFYEAERAQDRARADARLQALADLNQRNVEQRDKMDRETVQRAWDQYAARRKEEEDRAGGRVCGVVYGPGNSRYRTCMTRDHASKYYRGNF